MSNESRAEIIEALRSGEFVRVREVLADTNLPDMLLMRGFAEIGSSAWEAAEVTFSLLEPTAQNLMNLSLAQENLGKNKEALQNLVRANELGLAPDVQAGSYLNLSNLYRKNGAYEKAAELAQQAIEANADRAQALNCLALAQNKMGQYQEAEKNFDEAMQLAPNNPLLPLNLANSKIDQLLFDEAWPFFEKSKKIARTDHAAKNEGLARLLAGDYEEGFSLYEARLALAGGTRTLENVPRYKGESLKGKKLLILSEQGFGDTIHFCRFTSILKEGEIIWAVQPSLVSLLKENIGPNVISREGPLPEVDYYCPLLSLPLATGKMEPFGGTSYIKAPQAKKKLQGTQKIALIWKGSPTHQRDQERSLPLSFFDPLKSIFPDAHFYVPSLDVEKEELAQSALDITDLSGQISDFSDTASFLAQMDLVLSVDTSVAHLAAAMGRKTYIFLPYCPDWRWGIDGNKTPWYESVTLIRQKKPRHWTAGLLNEIT